MTKGLYIISQAPLEIALVRINVKREYSTVKCGNGKQLKRSKRYVLI